MKVKILTPAHNEEDVIERCILSVKKLAIPRNESLSEIAIDKMWDSCIKAVAEWTYEGHSIPLPVIMAHEMATIRKGLAEFLYSEMIQNQFSRNEKLSTLFLSLKEG